MTTPTKFRPASVRGKGRKTVELMGTVLAVFDDFDGSMSTRQVYYQLVSRGAVENKPSEYARVQRLLVQMRREGLVDYGRVVDRTRAKHHRQGWDGVEEIMGQVAVQYRRDLWTDQRTIVMVACEKQALEGIFAEVVDAYGASLWILRGYPSVAFSYEWSTEIRTLTARGKKVEIAYFGDHDPSGLDIEREAFDALIEHGADFEWSRYGLLASDFDRYELVKLPVKATDTRAKKYLARYGDQAAELDALRPDVLRERITGAIVSHIDAEAWSRLQRAEEAERASLNLVAGNWEQAVRAAAT